jgi:hypothetical protein
LAIGVAFAFICRGMARSRNRSLNLWTILGFFFPLISLIVLLIMGKDDSKAASA